MVKTEDRRHLTAVKSSDVMKSAGKVTVKAVV